MNLNIKIYANQFIEYILGQLSNLSYIFLEKMLTPLFFGRSILKGQQ